MTFKDAPLSIPEVANVAFELFDLRMHVPDMADQVPLPAEPHVAESALEILFIHVDTFHVFVNVLPARGRVVAQVAGYRDLGDMNVSDMFLDLAL